VVFDRRTAVKWSDKIYMKKKAVDGKTVRWWELKRVKN
jgi:hypothetical protein